jgi:hypothetical protein
LAGELEFFAGAGAASPASTAIDPAKINRAIRIGGSPCRKRFHFE